MGVNQFEPQVGWGSGSLRIAEFGKFIWNPSMRCQPQKEDSNWGCLIREKKNDFDALSSFPHIKMPIGGPSHHQSPIFRHTRQWHQRPSVKLMCNANTDLAWSDCHIPSTSVAMSQKQWRIPWWTSQSLGFTNVHPPKKNNIYIYYIYSISSVYI